MQGPELCVPSSLRTWLKHVVVVQIVELEFLWEKCCDADLATCHAACRALYELVTQSRCLDYHFVVSRLLNVAPSAKSVHYVMMSF